MSEQKTDSKKLWTIKELAEEWRVSEKTILRWIHAQKIEAMKLGRTYRIRSSVVTQGVSKVL